jgi:D-3-phosphoglycerate dehydrogenase
MKILGKLRIIDQNQFFKSEIYYHPILAFNIQVFRCLGCFEVVLEDPNHVVDERIKWKYDLKEISSSQDLADIVIELNCSNPNLSSNFLRTLVQSDSLRLIDCFGNECGVILRKGGESHDFKIPLDQGFSVDSPLKLAMAKAILNKNLDAADYPLIVRKEFEIIETSASLKPKLLFSAPYEFFSKELRTDIESNFDVTYAYQAPQDVVKELLEDKEIWIVSTCPPYFMDQSFFGCSKNLKLVATPSTGTNHLDKEYLVKNKIGLVSIKESPVINDISASSEMSLTLLLAMVKNLNLVSKDSIGGIWREQETIFRSREMQELTIGLIGLGRIGKNMARYCEALNMKVQYFDPYVNVGTYQKHESLATLLSTSDIVSLHYHLDSLTERSFDKQQFDLMKKGSYFLNTARGELVNENILLERLASGQIKAAAVDVISAEHTERKWDHPMVKYARENQNLILSPHVAGLTIDSESKAMNDLVRQVKAFCNENF